MDACPLLITSIVAVKPEDQGTFFQDFLGLSGYLCSVPEMLRTTMKPNELRIDAAEKDKVKTEVTVCRRLNPS
jgi:hypothetical protein